MNQASEAINLVSEAARQVYVDFLSLDDKACTRCGKTAANLDEAVAMLTPPLSAAGIEISVRRIKVDSLEAAQRHRLESSPTLRVDGRDIAGPPNETECADCGDACGCEGVRCRVWQYRGRQHDHAPVGLIVRAILAAAYQNCAPADEPRPYAVPENLRRFFAGSSDRKSAGAACCG